MLSRLNILLTLITAALSLYGTTMLQQLRVLGILGRAPGNSNVHGCDGQLRSIPGTRHCEDMHYHPRSGLLFAACEGPQSPRFRWNPPAAHFDEPESVPTGEGRGGLVVVNPKVGIFDNSRAALTPS